jgi:predicted TIM-barrel fold metal-dependent hydrolase
MKSYLDSISTIDTHSHILPFDKLPLVETDKGKQMTLFGLLFQSYFHWINPLSPWKAGEPFDKWWSRARGDFQNARATGFYRYLLPAFQDLYGVDFDEIDDQQARELNAQIARNYEEEKWIWDVVTEEANIELVVNDPYWEKLDHKPAYPFEVLVLNVTTLIWGYHESNFQSSHSNPYAWARKQGLKIETLEDYLNVLDSLFSWAKKRGAVSLKANIAYHRPLNFLSVQREAAAKAFGRPRSELRRKEVKLFEDFIMWELVRLSSKHDIPLQIHTGHALIQGSNPMLLVDMIHANQETKFILLHGGYPWVEEMGAIVHRYPRNVWVDSAWLPTIGYRTAKRGFHEWLEVMPSDRIMWGTDSSTPETIYGAAELTRRCLAEVLAEKIDRGELRAEHARRIGLQIMRENALSVYPTLRNKLWRHKGRLPR